MPALERGRGLLALAALAFALALSLGFLAAGDNVLPGDLWLARQIQAFDFPGAGELERAGYHLGGYGGALIPGIILIALLGMARRFSAATLIALTLLARSLNSSIKGIFESPRPPDDLIAVAADATANPATYGYPSGHVMGSVLFYGGLIYLTRRLLPPGPLRAALQSLALVIILIVAHSRIYSGVHWPTDTLGGALWGITLLNFLLVVYQSLHARSGQAVQRRISEHSEGPE